MQEVRYKYLGSKEIIEQKNNKLLRFLYSTSIGRIFLVLVCNKYISKFLGLILSTRLSSLFIKRYIKNNNINISDYEDKKYRSFNDFFTRNIKSIDREKDKNSFICPCDSKISVYNINKDLILKVKNTNYNIEELIKDNDLAKEYKDGVCVVYRLDPSNYHHYIFNDEGKILANKFIKGKLHTVNPIVYDKYKVFIENSREVTVLDTKNFGKIVQIEVGALCVGKIKNHNIKDFNKYDEKGLFEFGGSTIIQLLKRNQVVFDPEIISNTKKYIETAVNIGGVIGKKNKY